MQKTEKKKFFFMSKVSMSTEMDVDGQAVLSAAHMHNIVAFIGRKTRRTKEIAKISLVYAISQHEVPDKERVAANPYPLAGDDVFNGVVLDDDMTATFKVKVNALSTQEADSMFRFKIVCGNTCVFSDPFRVRSKTRRKRSRSEADSTDTSEYMEDNINFDLSWFDIGDQDLCTDSMLKGCCICRDLKEQMDRMEKLVNEIRQSQEDRVLLVDA